MKTSSTFKMDKEVKRVAATIVDPERRGAYKRLMIDALVSFEKARRESGKPKRNDGGEE
jgi:hypothetical protein